MVKKLGDHFFIEPDYRRVLVLFEVWRDVFPTVSIRATKDSRAFPFCVSTCKTCWPSDWLIDRVTGYMKGNETRQFRWCGDKRRTDWVSKWCDQRRWYVSLSVFPFLDDGESRWLLKQFLFSLKFSFHQIKWPFYANFIKNDTDLCASLLW